MRFGSVCSGIEAASVAWCQLGWKAAWLSEVDVSASAVLAHRFGASAPVFPLEGTEKSLKRIHWGDRIVNWGDMTRLPDAVRSGKAAAPEILCGGTPCQGFSVAGLRGGLSDPRGQLTLSFVELANAIDDKRTALGQQPCVIFWENVPGVRSDKGNAFGHYLAGLVGAEHPIEPGPRPEPGRSSAHWTWKKETREHIPKWPSAGVVAGPRRTAAWRSSDAQYFGLAQRRERVFVVASAREGFDPQVVLFEFDSLRRDSAPSREAWEDIAGTLAARTDGGGFPGTDEACSGYVQPIGSSSLVPQWWDGSPVSQTLDAVLHKGQTMPEKNRFPAVLQPVSVLPFNSTQIASPQNGANPKQGSPHFSLASGNHPPAVCIHGTQDPIVGYNIAHALGRNSGQENAVCVMSPVTHALKAEGFDASEDGTGRGQPIIAFSCKDYGNDATVDLSPTMRAMTHSASHANAGGQLAIQSEMAVRRLMPFAA